MIKWIYRPKMHVRRMIPHEDVDLLEVARFKSQNRDITRPVILNSRTDISMDGHYSYTILDGHHRVASRIIEEHGLIPAVLLDMHDDRIVLQWRRSIYARNTKLDIHKRSLEGRLYPIKTTKFMYRRKDNTLIPIGRMFMLKDGQAVYTGDKVR